jgi:hypothetical protein
MTGKLQIGNGADRYGRRIKKGIHSLMSYFPSEPFAAVLYAELFFDRFHASQVPKDFGIKRHVSEKNN